MIMKIIKAVLFDLDGTLRHNVPHGSDIFIENARALGIHINEQTVVNGLRWELQYWANSQELIDDLKLFEDSDPDFWLNYNKRHLIAFEVEVQRAEELAPIQSQFMQDHYKHESVIPDDVLRALTHLQQTGYRLGVVSNRDVPFTEELSALNIAHFFEFSLAAGEIKSYKPDREIFDAALNKLGMPAHETMYVGDNFYADVIGSHRAGLMPVLYDPRGLFPEAECAVIKSFDELAGLL